MKLLIITQKVDKNDPTLGFFHDWIIELSKKAESVSVVCLKKGSMDLPSNVTLYSLGKSNAEQTRNRRGTMRIKYILNLYKYLSKLSGSYDKVFVHMNQEYVLLAGLYWKMKKIPVYTWRNHPNGGILTNIAVLLSTKVFSTSKASFVARFKKAVIMPVGIDVKIFKPLDGVIRKKHSVCMVGRISPIKHIELGLMALKKLIDSGVQVSLDILGPIAERDQSYANVLRDYVNKNNLASFVNFLSPVASSKLAEIYSSYEICLNLTESGSFDKTIVEASACGAIPLVSNISLWHLLPEVCITNDSLEAVALSLEKLLNVHEQMEIQEKLKSFVESQSLDNLMEKLFLEMK